MARGAMTPAEPHVQQTTCDPTQGDESSTLPVMEVLPPSRTHSHSHKGHVYFFLSATFLVFSPMPGHSTAVGLSNWACCCEAWTSTRPEKGRSYLRFQGLTLLS